MGPFKLKFYKVKNMGQVIKSISEIQYETRN